MSALYPDPASTGPKPVFLGITDRQPAYILYDICCLCGSCGCDIVSTIIQASQNDAWHKIDLLNYFKGDLHGRLFIYLQNCKSYIYEQKQ